MPFEDQTKDNEDEELQYLSQYQTVWQRIKELLKPPEVEPIQTVIGTSIVEDNEILVEELRNLVTILQEYRESNDNINANHKAILTSLPPPPSRGLLHTRLQTLILRIVQGGHTVDTITPREKEIIGFVVNPDVPSRPSSASSHRTFDGEGSLSCSIGPPSARLSQSFSPEKHKNKLNIMEVDGIIEDIRGAIKEEKKFLLEETDSVRARLEEEMDHNAKSKRFRVPTVKELTDLQEKLESEEKKLEHQIKIESLPEPRKRGILSNGVLEVEMDKKNSFTNHSEPKNCSSRANTPPSSIFDTPFDPPSPTKDMILSPTASEMGASLPSPPTRSASSRRPFTRQTIAAEHCNDKSCSHKHQPQVAANTFSSSWLNTTITTTKMDGNGLYDGVVGTRIKAAKRPARSATANRVS